MLVGTGNSMTDVVGVWFEIVARTMLIRRRLAIIRARSRGVQHQWAKYDV